ncbi:MAG: YfhO family protein [Marinilabiliaceae bacterium]
MNIQRLKPVLIFAGIIALFVFLSLLYFSPVLKGFGLPQMDQTHAVGMAQELVEHEKATGERVHWTNSMFGGMPAYQIRGDSSHNIFSYINKILRVGLPYHTAAILFLYLLGFYVLLRSMKINRWLSVLGAVAFGFGSYNIIIIMAGHITKAYTIALMAPVIAGILYTLNRDRWVGALFTTLALGAQIAYNHVQITYYLALMVLILMISRLIYAWRDGQLTDFVKRGAVLIGAAVIALLPNLIHLWPTYEYGQFSTRGPSELESRRNDGTQDAGLDRDYAFSWSYGKAETLSLMIPNVMGGASEPLSESPRAMEEVDSRLHQIVGSQSQYWGSKPFTSGPVYVGAFVCFLFVMALFFYKGREKWWLVAATIFSIILAWGQNLEWFNYWMFDVFPLYNKFRTVEMTLVIATVTIPLLGVMGLKKVMDDPSLIREQSGKFLAAFGLTGGVALLLYLFPGLFFDFVSEREMSALMQQKQNMPEQAGAIDEVIRNMKQARIGLLKSDAVRSFFFILLGSGSLWLYATNRVSRKYILPGLALLVIVDLWAVDKRYLSNDDFVPHRQLEQNFEKSKADDYILRDDDLYFRVFSIHQNPFNEVQTSYFHKSIGGYHGAKLGIYQDVIDYYLQNNWQTLNGHFKNNGSTEEAKKMLADMPVLNMLNTKYVIYNPGQQPIENPNRYGNAWFVDRVQTAPSSRQELSSLQDADLKSEAIVREDRAGGWASYKNDDEGGDIRLTSYEPDRLEYNVNAPSKKLAVFSEIFYPKGWKAYIDGEEAEIKRVNYILRGVMIPEGEHDLEFRFEPSSVQTANRIAVIGGLLIVLFAIWLMVRYRKRLAGKS